MIAALLAAALAALAASPAAEADTAIVPGQVTERIVSRQSPDQSYAVFVPSAYTPERAWPSLFLLDARGRALLPIERFRKAAEELGWILVSSYNSRSDTAGDPNSPAMTAMWKDASLRLALDERRVTASGFSGGARAAVAMAMSVDGAFSGVIGCGAGFPDEKAKIGKLAFPYYGTIGDRDFNYYEMRELDRKLDEAGAAHRIEIFGGGHDWPPEAVARRAIVWMELDAMRRGARPGDAARVATLHAEALARAKSAEAEGRSVEAADLYAALAQDFRGLAAVGEAESRARELASRPAVKKAVRDALRRDDRDRAALRSLGGKLLGAMNASEPPLPGVLAAELGIGTLKKRAVSAATPEERLSAERILANLRVQASFYLPQQLSERGDPARARMLLQVAGEIDPKDPYVDYNLAALSARSGDAPRAVKDLSRAVEKGFRRFDLLDGDSDFDPIRADPGFQKWLAQARTPQGARRDPARRKNTAIHA